MSAKPSILLVTPPFTQLNTPYPATAYLKGYLNTISVTSHQLDMGIDVILAIFSKAGLQHLFGSVEFQTHWSANSKRIYDLQEEYIQTIDATIAFLQGKSATLATNICLGNFLPEASRFDTIADLEWAFGAMGTRDKAMHLATLYLEDIADFITECVDTNFGFSRYAERLGRSASSFDALHEQLQGTPTFIDQIMVTILEEKIAQYQPSVVGFSIPFPGNLYAGFRMAKWLKTHHPHIKITIGGGYPNTELRSVTDIRVFDYIDYITLDDGEMPIQVLLSHIEGTTPKELLKRTLLRDNDEVKYYDGSLMPDVKQTHTGTPDYSDLRIKEYISVIEIANPMHSLWSDGRWNKLTLAHGCYWGKCTFCDISLDYIGNYEPNTAALLVDRIETIIAQTGETGFHFVDEAAPPALMKELALEIIRRGITITWWTNIRFEKNFSRDLCSLLAASGCIAVSGGLEVASDRLLELMKKGVTVAQVAKVADNFTAAGIMVHAYLMYGFPTQTAQETVDALEVVRQLFENEVLQSGFWHQFAMTAHSPIGLNPEKYKLQRKDKTTGKFANNDLEHLDPTGAKHELFSEGLKKSLFNYMHGMCFDFPLQKWFDFKVPNTTVAPDMIELALDDRTDRYPRNNHQLIWLGKEPSLKKQQKKTKGVVEITGILKFNTKRSFFTMEEDYALAEWIKNEIPKMRIFTGNDKYTFIAFKTSFEETFETPFELFWQSELVENWRSEGLLLV